VLNLRNELSFYFKRMHLGQAFWLTAQVSLVSAVWVMITFWPIAPTGPVVVTISVWAMFIENVVLRLDSHALPYRPAINPHLPIWTHRSHRLLGPSPDSSPPSMIILPFLRVSPPPPVSVPWFLSLWCIIVPEFVDDGDEVESAAPPSFLEHPHPCRFLPFEPLGFQAG
jgi:hypothetical protein